jgi:hypothetical protein
MAFFLLFVMSYFSLWVGVLNIRDLGERNRSRGRGTASPHDRHHGRRCVTSYVPSPFHDAAQKAESPAPVVVTVIVAVDPSALSTTAA